MLVKRLQLLYNLHWSLPIGDGDGTSEGWAVTVTGETGTRVTGAMGTGATVSAVRATTTTQAENTWSAKGNGTAYSTVHLINDL
jgi:hypothetical protein